MIVAALGHDLDHYGMNNMFHNKIQDEKAMLYHGQATLENYHLSMLWQILNLDECNIFVNLKSDQMESARKAINKIVMDTEMAQHSAKMTEIKDLFV